MMIRLQIARQRIETARNYTLRFLDNTPLTDWSKIPAAGVSHIAWQVGHLAMAEYRLALERIRDRTDDDRRLISDEFLRAFARESVPTSDLPFSVEMIRDTFNRVHQQVLTESGSWTEDALAAPALKPHPIVKTKLEALDWCANHELVHAGQIGLLRRQLGHSPLW
ncbi:MAG: hypothetical protein B7Z37_01490 [Verrucomicrobia bacterium 12-59-8]|nr:MAG: hypothetical protein B7Z37_01490 [Verrucomicrobia bacterium 12-59-8]